MDRSALLASCCRRPESRLCVNGPMTLSPPPRLVGHEAALSSTIRPSLRDRTRRACSATSWSWVIMTMVLPRSRFNALENSEDLQSAAAVQVPGGLVRQKDDGIINQCPGNCHTLLLTSRELARHVVFAIAEPDSIDDFECPLLGIAEL